MPAEGERFLARLQVPHLDRVVMAPRVQPLAVRRERQARHPTRMPGMPGEGARYLARLQVPHLDLSASTPREQPLAVRGQRQARNLTGTPAEGARMLAR